MTPIPPKPAQFSADLAPVGVEVKFVTFLDDRPPMTPDLIHWHTNGAGGEGTVDSAWRHTHAAPNQNTLPHYQLDRTHDGVTRCRKMCPTDRKGIGSMTVSRSSRDSNGRLIWPTLTVAQRAEIDAHPGRGVATRTIVIETADTGYLADPTISAFDAGQVELAATITAYESIVWGIPLRFPGHWWEPGVASHTDPDGFPFTSNSRGKICPGSKKKAQVRNEILARAAVIAAAWLDVSPPPPPPPPAPQPTPTPNPPEDEMVDADDIKGVWIAPPPDQVGAGSPNLVWFNAVLLKVGPVSAVQARNNLKVTGIYDAATRAAYDKELAVMKAAAGV